MPRLKGQQNLGTYLKYINEIGIPSTRIITGRFYVYKYLFNQNVKFDILKFYDVFPLTFVYEQKGKNFYGLNFHHMPPRSRLIWLARVKRYSSLLVEDKRVTNLLEYSTLKSMFKKSTYGVRQYKKISVRDLKRVEYDELEKTMRFFANTYFAASVASVFNKYRSFIPKP